MIKDIDNNISCDHLKPDCLFGREKHIGAKIRHCLGAKQELIAIFDIKESEL